MFWFAFFRWTRPTRPSEAQREDEGVSIFGGSFGKNLELIRREMGALALPLNGALAFRR